MFHECDQCGRRWPSLDVMYCTWDGDQPLAFCDFGEGCDAEPPQNPTPAYFED